MLSSPQSQEMFKLTLFCALLAACSEAERDTWVWPEEQPKLGCVSLDDDVFASCNGNYDNTGASNRCTSQVNSYCISGKCTNRCACSKKTTPACTTPCMTWNYPTCRNYVAGKTWGTCGRASAAETDSGLVAEE